VVGERSYFGPFGSATVSYALDSDGVTLSGLERDFANRRVLPLVFETPRGAEAMRHLVCGISRLGKGYVILRPMTLDGPRDAEVTPFETQLLEFSRNPTAEDWVDPSRVNPRRDNISPPRQPQVYPRKRGVR